MLILARQLKVIIIVPTILCTIMIINVLFYVKPVYTSTSKIMSSSSSGSTSQAAGIAAQFGIALPTTNPNQNGFILKLSIAGLWPEFYLNESLIQMNLVHKSLRFDLWK